MCRAFLQITSQVRGRGWEDVGNPLNVPLLISLCLKRYKNRFKTKGIC